MEWKGRDEGPHAISLMGRISTNAKRTFVFMGMERILSN